ncbi:LysM peptidoglycan-binding domain-containing protein [Paenibacillus sp. FSL H7-0331]|uniref:LysM peptidoglycan-binding domain-containing protein n=1 Tax=Paenibacillus sp. FSL H7-0331 TaxID=1920421 RepID=UPI002115EEA7|nr:LysM peptidoglycan-binding domain-containing protein [Paenibacillus sp. FSL H7-0331]
MYYATPWTPDPHFQSYFRPLNDYAVYPIRSNYGQSNYNPYAQPVVPFLRYESVSPQKSACISSAEVELNQAFRTLWEQHVAWTRMLIISIAESLPDEALVTERLLRNPPDMANVFKHYYGEEIAKRFSALFREHLVLAAQLVKAAKAGNSRAAAEAEKNWYANADEIAAFLNSINPNWPKADLRNMLHEHLRMTKDQAVFRLSKKYKSDIATYDQIEKQALEMADAFTNGIVKQFPNHF